VREGDTHAHTPMPTPTCRGGKSTAPRRVGMLFTVAKNVFSLSCKTMFSCAGVAWRGEWGGVGSLLEGAQAVGGLQRIAVGEGAVTVTVGPSAPAPTTQVSWGHRQCGTGGRGGGRQRFKRPSLQRAAHWVERNTVRRLHHSVNLALLPFASEVLQLSRALATAGQLLQATRPPGYLGCSCAALSPSHWIRFNSNCTHSYTYRHTHTCTHVRARTHLHTHVLAHSHIHTHMRASTQTHRRRQGAHLVGVQAAQRVRALHVKVLVGQVDDALVHHLVQHAHFTQHLCVRRGGSR